MDITPRGRVCLPYGQNTQSALQTLIVSHKTILGRNAFCLCRRILARIPVASRRDWVSSRSTFSRKPSELAPKGGVLCTLLSSIAYNLLRVQVPLGVYLGHANLWYQGNCLGGFRLVMLHSHPSGTTTQGGTRRVGGRDCSEPSARPAKSRVNSWDGK